MNNREDKVSERKKMLLLRINQTALSADQRELYLSLVQKQEAQTISKSERAVCLELAAKDAKLRNERVKLMIELAELRNVSSNEVMTDLGLQPLMNAG